MALDVINRVKGFFSSSKKISTDAGKSAQALMSESVEYKKQGDSHLEQGAYLQAISCYQQAIANDAYFANAYCNLGYAQLQLAQHQAAAENVARALSINPSLPDAHYLSGVLARISNDLDAACSHFEQALRLSPEFEAACLDLCQLLFQRGQLPAARQIIAQGIAINAGNADFHFYLGNIYSAQQEFDPAVQSYRTALLIRPDYLEVLSNLGLALLKKNDPESAIVIFRQVLAMRPDSADIYLNMGIAFRDVGQLHAAADSFRRATELNPDYAIAYSNLGLTLRALGRLDDAVACCKQAIELDPTFTDAYGNLSDALRGLKQYEAAIVSCRRALQIDPHLIDIKRALGALLLLLGQSEEGWSLYQSCAQSLQAMPGVIPAHLPFPQWQGQSLHGKSILIWCEQGLGDQIQFSRFASDLKQQGARHVSLLCMKPLKNLFERLEGVDEIKTFAADAVIPQHDYWTFSFAIPLYCKAVLSNLSDSVPYLHADAVRERDLAVKFAGIAEYKVGLCWKGATGYNRDDERSPGLEPFKKLFALDRVLFFTLMIDSRNEFMQAAGSTGFDLGHEVDAATPPFEECAALIMNLDLVITCDTSIGHLAGALGKAVWLALPFDAEWRWFANREDSPWYPHTRLFRQSARGGWEELFDRMALRLQSVAHGKTLAVWAIEDNESTKHQET